jgi:signal peptidase I
VKVPKERMIKRVTGLPDDLVHTDDAKLVRVPRGYCWVEGDNAPVSLDSNVFGAVP